MADSKEILVAIAEKLASDPDWLNRIETEIVFGNHDAKELRRLIGMVASDFKDPKVGVPLGDQLDLIAGKAAN